MYILLFLATLLLALWVLYASKASSTNVVEASIWSTSKTCAKVLRVTPMLAWWRPFIGLKQLSLSFNRIPPPTHTHTRCSKSFYKTLFLCPVLSLPFVSTACQPCPPNTAPVYGIDYIRWHQLPPKMDSTCLSLSCKSESYIQSYIYMFVCVVLIFVLPIYTDVLPVYTNVGKPKINIMCVVLSFSLWERLC